MQKPVLKEGTKQWERAVSSFKQYGNLNMVREHVHVTDEQESKIMEQAKDVA